MSAIVLDASVAIALVVDEPGSPAAVAAVAGCEALVPDTFWGEVASALVRKVGTGAISRTDALAAFGLLRRLVERTLPTEPLGTFAMTLALELGHPVYDCLYLAAAIAHGTPLLTADRTLHAQAVDAGYGASVRLVGRQGGPLR